MLHRNAIPPPFNFLRNIYLFETKEGREGKREGKRKEGRDTGRDGLVEGKLPGTVQLALHFTIDLGKTKLCRIDLQTFHFHSIHLLWMT